MSKNKSTEVHGSTKPIENLREIEHAPVVFDATDCIVTINDGKMHVNAKLEFPAFNEIIENNLIYILEYLKSKNFNISYHDNNGKKS